MPRMTWSAPEGRFFDAGLDRGVLYPKKLEPLGPISYTNMVRNPRAGVNADWALSLGSGGAATRTWFANGGWGDLPFVRMTWTTPPGGGNKGIDVDRMSVVGSIDPLKSYSAAIRIWGSIPNAQLQVNWYDAAGGHLSSFYSDMLNPGDTPGAATLYTFEGMQPPEGASRFLLRAFVGPGLVAGQVLNATAAMLVQNEKLPEAYFDGASPDTGLYRFDWFGADNDSESFRRDRVSLAVPWVGLTNVEEKGGDGAAAYYIDGRPFLFLPKPKEYSATLKAYTYPDSFSEIMGVTEIADGMYLDSQPGDSFDLSYRTKVGNALQGVDHGYKIHLVYNAVVTPQSLSYDTLGSSVNPVEFSWDIQAVPVKVEGFRPTAHIIIDTRHMAPARIAEIENLLYGSDSSLAGMPTPQTIFDLLNYGDTIIVTDLGDGNFSVEGAYENVYMVEPGVFRVDNVDGETYADGTFRISSTNV
jgi:hypothetical protein